MNATQVAVLTETAKYLHCVHTVIMVTVHLKTTVYNIQYDWTMIAVMLISDYNRTAITIAIHLKIVLHCILFHCDHSHSHIDI